MEDDSENPENQIGSSSKRPVSGEGKLWIKLKFPAPAGGDEVVEAQKNDQPRICNVCNKGFRSGKALGGHMRVHVQENRELKKKMIHGRELAVDNRDDPNAADQEKPTCSICGKSFPSMKSLFGHMRCHPERDYRGIQPPPAAVMDADTSSSSSVSDAEKSDDEDDVGDPNLVTDLVQSLPRWSVTAKRGRKSADCEISEEEAHAAHHLLSLAGGDSLESGLTYKHRIEASNSNSLTNRPETELKKKRFGKAPATDHFPAKSGEFGTRGFTDDESDSTGSEQLIMNFKCQSAKSSMMMMKSKKKRKKLKLSDLESITPADHDQVPAGIAIAPSPEDRYKCSTCNKCFQTHQALGGHRSSHNKANKTCLAIEESSFIGAEDELQAKPVSRLAEENEGAGSSKPAESIHQCKICSKIFPTGQALGGHKRCHWSGSAVGAETPPSQAASPGEASHTGRKMLGFDLNELPPMEDEDGIESEHVGGYGYYASSSYNSSVA